MIATTRHLISNPNIDAAGQAEGAGCDATGTFGGRGRVPPTVDKHLALLSAGEDEAIRMVGNHRLREMYVITHADFTPQHVDREADRIEYMLSPEMINELETLVEQDEPAHGGPTSPMP